MNKEKLKKYIKKNLATDVFFNIQIISKKVYFSLYDYNNREVCFIEIPYKNLLHKKEIYIAISKLVTNFDFSFRVVFDNIKDIYKFLEVEK